ncbi:bacteriocin immunity protein [Leuconostoc falkenbergense]|uniref:bacteriocin immunity protein n=1 Tax=Leuconostoc falkenbergense TaxID=2766470 RepID=UPI0024A8BF88|nr:bacteriocin immunity protein [Leuconostoc falkenbergense]MDI6554223.1 bacteriocin immunity protein [Leuconostoc falkenbergense]
MKFPNEKWLLNALTDLILDENTSQIERNILVSYKRDLEKTNNDRSIAYHLKQELSLLSMKQQATSNVVSFLSELSQHYNGLDVGIIF